MPDFDGAQFVLLVEDHVALPDQAAHGRDAGAGGDEKERAPEEERVLGVDVEGAVGEGGGDASAGLEGRDVARAHALADFAEDGAVAHEGDGEVEGGGFFAVGLAQYAAGGDGELAAAEAGEEGQGVVEG